MLNYYRNEEAIISTLGNLWCELCKYVGACANDLDPDTITGMNGDEECTAHCERVFRESCTARRYIGALQTGIDHATRKLNKKPYFSGFPETVKALGCLWVQIRDELQNVPYCYSSCDGEVFARYPDDESTQKYIDKGFEDSQELRDYMEALEWLIQSMKPKKEKSDADHA